MKFIKNFLHWFIAICIMLIGLILLTSSILAGILWLIAGIILFPKVLRKIPEFPKRKLALSVVVVTCLIVGICALPESEGGNDSRSKSAMADTEMPKKQDKLSSTEQAETEKEEDKAEPAKNNEPDKDEPDTESGVPKEEIRQWIEENLEKDISDSKIAKFKKKTNEMAFLAAWKECLSAEVKEITTVSRYGISAIGDYCDFYRRVWNDSDQIKNISDKYLQMMDDFSKKEEFQSKYSVSLGTAKQVYTGDFYVSQRLEQSYADNLLGDLQKAIDDYSADNTSDWISYNVEYDYLLETTFAGDDCYILHSDVLNPFSDSGAYNITYVDMDKTMDLVNGRGFQMTVPVYYIVDAASYQNDQAAWNKLDSEQNRLLDEIAKELDLK